MKELVKKLFYIQKNRPNLSKDWKAVYWKYITLDNLIETYEPLLNEQWIVIIHRSVVWWIETQLIDQENWEYVSSEIMLPVWLTAQTTWSWITYAKRYNLWMLLNVIVNEDDDWQNAEKQSKQAPTEKPEITMEQLKKQFAKVQAKVDAKEECPKKPAFTAKLSDYYKLNEKAFEAIDTFYSTIIR